MNIAPLFIAVPLFTAFLTPVLSRVREGIADVLSNAATATLLALSLAALYGVHTKGVIIYTFGGWSPPFGINLVVDGLSALLLVTISLISVMITIFSTKYMDRFTDKPKYYTLLMLMVAGMCGVVLTGDMFNMYVFIEMAAVSSYALVAFGCESDELEAAFKYMVLGSLASAFILFGIIILYSFTGSLNMAQISSIIAEKGASPPVQLCFALFLMGFGLKAALVPFHAWLPDAHPSAPAPISAMLSGVLIKAIGVYALSRVVFNVFGMNMLFSEILMILGTLSMIVGVLLAIGQWDFKRLLAYHSVSQMGYVVLGLGIGTPLSILGGLFHLFNHASFKSLLFLNSGAVEYGSGTRDLHEMGGLKEKMPVTSATSLIASASIAGIPPFNGFWSKLIIIVAAVQAGHMAYALVAIVASILTLASFMKVQRYGFHGKLKEGLAAVKEAPAAMCLSMIALAAICTAAGLAFPIVLRYLIDPAVSVLLNGLGYSGLILGG